MNTSERDEKAQQASAILQDNRSQFDSKPLQLKTMKSDFFDAEVGIDGNDFVFHFYKPKAWRGFDQYWDEYFPAALDAAARKYFDAEFPRLMAQHVKDEDVKVGFGGDIDVVSEDGKSLIHRGDERIMDSWWFRAKGFAGISLDPDKRVAGFYEALSTELNKKQK